MSEPKPEPMPRTIGNLWDLILQAYDQYDEDQVSVRYFTTDELASLSGIRDICDRLEAVDETPDSAGFDPDRPMDVVLDRCWQARDDGLIEHAENLFTDTDEEALNSWRSNEEWLAKQNATPTSEVPDAEVTP